MLVSALPICTGQNTRKDLLLLFDYARPYRMRADALVR